MKRLDELVGLDPLSARHQPAAELGDGSHEADEVVRVDDVHTLLAAHPGGNRGNMRAVLLSLDSMDHEPEDGCSSQDLNASIPSVHLDLVAHPQSGPGIRRVTPD